MGNGRVTISEGRLRSLLETEFEMICLQNGGVDNWTWYGDSMPSENATKEYVNQELEDIKHG